MATQPNPSTKSSAYCRMEAGWKVIDDILAGPETIRANSILYLPAYAKEGDAEYKRRLAQAPWRPEFADILQSLASKPFSKEIALGDGASARVKALTEDIDQRGANLTAFSRGVFRGGIAKGMHAILVDYPSMSAATTRTAADEKRAGARPYWVSIRAEDILALYTEFVDGREIVSHVRIRETATARNGFEETSVERVRVLEPTRWELWEATSKVSDVDVYTKIGEGPLTLGVVPLALFWTGERDGAQFVRPPLASLANMQIELYRKLSRQDEIETYAGSPMLQAKGIAAPREGDPPLEIGPKRILFAPPGVEGSETGWSYIQPDWQILKEIRESGQATRDDMRRLGMQPLAQESGDVTATAASIEGAKAHSTVEAWALGLKDVLEQAFVFTAKWLGEPEGAEVEVNTDFSVEPYAQAPLDALHKARASGDLTQRTYWSGLRRFDVLAPDFDADAEEMDLAAEAELQPDPAPAPAPQPDPDPAPKA